MVLIISDDDAYPVVKINNFASVYSIYLKQGIAQGVMQRHGCIAGTLTSTGDHSPDGWIPTLLNHLKRRLSQLCALFKMNAGEFLISFYEDI